MLLPGHSLTSPSTMRYLARNLAVVYDRDVLQERMVQLVQAQKQKIYQYFFHQAIKYLGYFFRKI